MLDVFLEHGCTVIVPTFSRVYTIPPEPERRLERNYPDDNKFDNPPPGRNMVYTCDSQEIDNVMGAIPAALLAVRGRFRGYHPMCSFAAVGPLAQDLVACQSPQDVYGPVRELSRMGGRILLMGVGLERVTALHYAEQMAGRKLFRKWANGLDGEPIPSAVGGQSHGFEKLNHILSSEESQLAMGQGLWRAFPVEGLLKHASNAIREDPMATHCGQSDCRPCNEAMAGGPVITN